MYGLSKRSKILTLRNFYTARNFYQYSYFMILKLHFFVKYAYIHHLRKSDFTCRISTKYFYQKITYVALLRKKYVFRIIFPPLNPHPRPCNLLQGCPLFGINRVGWAKIHCEHILLDWLRQCRWIYQLWQDFEEWTYQFCWSFLIFEINEKGASASTSMWGL